MNRGSLAPLVPTELVDRLSAATAGSRELDGDLAEVLRQSPPPPAFRMVGTVDAAQWATSAYDHWKAPAYTTSIDAALALAERVLPGLDIDLEVRPTHEGMTTDAIIYSHGYGPDPFTRWDAYAPTPALALCIAILKALAAQASDTDEKTGGEG